MNNPKHWLWSLSTGGRPGSTGLTCAATAQQAFRSELAHPEIPDAASQAFPAGLPAGSVTEDGPNQLTFTAEGNVVLRIEQVKCPDTSRYLGDIVGCGSANLSERDEEGLIDCRNCGLFFDPLINQAVSA